MLVSIIVLGAGVAGRATAFELTAAMLAQRENIPVLRSPSAETLRGRAKAGGALDRTSVPEIAADCATAV